VMEVLAWEYSVENLLAAYRRVFCKHGKNRGDLQHSKVVGARDSS